MASKVTHMLDEGAIALLLESLDREKAATRDELRLAIRTNDLVRQEELEDRYTRLHALMDLVDAGAVLCEHEGRCNSSTGCNHRRLNNAIAEQLEVA